MPPGKPETLEELCDRLGIKTVDGDTFDRECEETYMLGCCTSCADAYRAKRRRASYATTPVVPQCDQYALRDGHNACTLEIGHPGPHENCAGNREGPWGTRKELLAALEKRKRERETRLERDRQ